MSNEAKTVRDNKICQFLEPDVKAKEGVSILHQKLSDSQGFVFCYLFKNFWIELSPCRKLNYSDIASHKIRWEAFIHNCANNNGNRTAFALGSYTTRLEAAMKAEKVIVEWHLQLK